MRERDIKLLLVLLIAVIGIASYYFAIKPAVEHNEAIEKEIADLQAEKLRLEEHAAKLGEYQEGMNENAAKVGEILAHYPQSLPQEAELLFLNRTENRIPIRLDSVSFSSYVRTSVAGDEARQEALTDDESVRVGTVLTGIRSDLALNYTAGYREFQDFLAYIRNYPERMVITRINASYNHERAEVSGSMSLSLYAIDGSGRPPVAVNAPAFDRGRANIFLPAQGLLWPAPPDDGNDDDIDDLGDDE